MTKTEMKPVQDKSLRVWGIGLTRTGTTSLNKALEILGFRSVHWPTTSELLYGDLEAATDESVAAVYKYLDFRFPHSKFILTERSEDDWLTSTALHRIGFIKNFGNLIKRPHGAEPPLDRWVEIVFTHTSLYGTVYFDRDKFVAGYRKYHSEVADYFSTSQDKLLRLRICDGEGWSKLCKFLERPIPSQPFPHANPGSQPTEGA